MLRQMLLKPLVVAIIRQKFVVIHEIYPGLERCEVFWRCSMTITD